MGERSALALVTGWLLFGSLAACTGSVAGRWVIVPPGQEDLGLPVREVRRTAARFGRAGAVCLLAALVLVLARQLHEFRDPFEPWGAETRLLLAGTAWGRVWVVGAALAVVTAGAFHRAAGGAEAGWWPATVATICLNAFPAFTGHASGGEVRWLTLPADVLHVTAAGGWIGALSLVLRLEGHARRMGERATPSVLPALVPRFSRLAIACVATLAVTGAIASVVNVGSVAHLVGTAYGRLLLVKFVLVGGVLALGAANYAWVTPRLRDPDVRAGMVRLAMAELALAGLVLAATALLVRTDPAALP